MEIMDTSFLNPITIGEIIVAIIILLLLCKLTGFNFSKGENGKMRFGFSSKNEKSLDRIEAKLKDMQAGVVELKNLSNKHEKQINEMRLDSLKKGVYNKEIPLEDRMFLAYRYLKLGGNSSCKTFIEEQLVPLNQILWESINKNMKEIKI
jgi:hypothetical protein